MAFRNTVAFWIGLVAVFHVWSPDVSAQQPNQQKQAKQERQNRRGRFTWETVLQRHDANEDGKVTREEWQGPPQLFGRMDADGDGTISKSEFETRHNRRRERGRPRSDAPRPDASRHEASWIPDGVTLTPDIAYRDGNDEWRLDLAMPAAPAATPRPAIVFVHGGGWRSGDKGGGQWRSLPLEYAGKGYFCISVNYRLTGEAPFPACVEDVKCAVRWLRANAKKCGVDPKRVGAYGNSAGAHLVSMLGLAGPDAELEGDGPYQGQSSRVQAVCCSAPPTDFSNWGGPGQLKMWY